MEKLSSLVNVEVAKLEFTRTVNISVTSVQVTRDVRLALYGEAKPSGLLDEGDQPVSRRKLTTWKTVKEKHINDICCDVLH